MAGEAQIQVGPEAERLLRAMRRVRELSRAPVGEVGGEPAVMFSLVQVWHEGVGALWQVNAKLRGRSWPQPWSEGLSLAEAIEKVAEQVERHLA